MKCSGLQPVIVHTTQVLQQGSDQLISWAMSLLNGFNNYFIGNHALKQLRFLQTI